MSDIKRAKRIVIKVGTSTLTYATGHLNLRRVERLVKVLADIRNSGREVLLVTSAAIGVGGGLLGLRERPQDIGGRQAAAAVGQCELMYTYDRLFGEYGQHVAQLLLTRDVVEEGIQRQNVVNTLSQLLTWNVLPIINENDTIATEELEGSRIGDNDTLSAIVATLADAQGLILLTDIDGLYDADPRTNADAKRIPVVRDIDDALLEQVGGAGSNRGTGGMRTKLQAARIAQAAGIPTVIMQGERPQLLYDLLEGKDVGTLITAAEGSK